MSDEHFLSRWSRLKKAERRGEATGEAPAIAKESGPANAGPIEAPQAGEPAPPPLPPVESLTPESDFTGFMKPDVDPSLRSRALKALFQDARLNVAFRDGLDVYTADYSIPDPLPPEWLGQLRQMARLGDYHEPPPEEAEKAPAEPVDDADASSPTAENVQSQERLEHPEGPDSPAGTEDKALPPPVGESGPVG